MRYRDEERPRTAAEALRNSHNADVLRKMLKPLCAGKLPTRKEEIVSLLVNHLQGDGLHQTWLKLDELERSAIAEAVYAKAGMLDAQRVRAKYGTVPQSATLDLIMPRGVLPIETQQSLRKFVAKPKPAAIQTNERPPDSVEQYGKRILLNQRAMEGAALRDLPAVLRTVEAGKVAVGEKARWPTSGSINTIGKFLEGGDFFEQTGPPSDTATDDDPGVEELDDWEDEKPGAIRAFAWPMLLQAGKLVQVNGKRLALTKAGKAALKAPAHETLRELWDHWFDTTLLDEFRRVDRIKGQSGKGRRTFSAPGDRRKAIAAALADCPVGCWVEVSEFSRHMRAAGHHFTVSDNPWSLYIADPKYGSLGYNGSNDWHILQLRYILAMLFEYAATLGMLDVAYVDPAGARGDYHDMWGTDELTFLSRYDGLLYFRVTPLGAFCLGLSEEYIPPPATTAALCVLPNLDVVTMEGPVSPADRLVLGTFAQETSDRTWRLDRDKILAAVAAGRTVDELRRFLAAAVTRGLPDTATQFLADLEHRASALRDIGPARLIQCADPATATLLAHDRSTTRLCSSLGEDLLVVWDKDRAAFTRAVAKLGYVIPPAENT